MNPNLDTDGPAGSVLSLEGSSGAAYRIGLIVVTGNQIPYAQLESIVTQAKLAGISQVICLEPRQKTSPKVEEPRHEGSKIVCLSIQNIHELGGNLKLGLAYSVREQLDLVLIWTSHHSPSSKIFQEVIRPFENREIAAVFTAGGSRKWDWKSGVRAYRMDSLQRIPFHFNTNENHFDYEIFLQLEAVGARVHRLQLSDSITCAFVSRHWIDSKLRRMGSRARYYANHLAIIYHPKFDFLRDEDRYIFKNEETSLHQHVLRYSIRKNEMVVELGAGLGNISHAFHQKGAKVLAIDLRRPTKELPFPYLEHDLEEGFADHVLKYQGPADVVVMLDVIEHLADPERSMKDVWRLLKPGGTLLLSTANVAFLPVRGMLAFGLFNYGRRGILDLTHRRLFTYKSIKRLLIDSQFTPEKWLGFGPPIADLISRKPLFMFLDRVCASLAKLRPSLFGYQIFVQATRREGLGDLFQKSSSMEKSS